MKRNKKKDLIIYNVYSTNTYDYEGMECVSDTLLGSYFTKEAAIADLINTLNFEYEADIQEESEELLNEYLDEHERDSYDKGFNGWTWRIDEVVVSDKSRDLEI